MDSFGGDAIAIIAGSLLMEGEINRLAFELTIKRLFTINDALRIKIYCNENEIGQLFDGAGFKRPKIISFDTIDEFKDWARSESKKKIELYEELFQVTGIDLKNRCGVYIKIHHIISDGWSLSLLLQQFITIYKSLCDNATFDIVAGSFKEYVTKTVKGYSLQGRRERDRDYWNSMLSQCSDCFSLSNSVSADLSSSRVSYEIDNVLLSRLKEYCEKNRVSVFCVLLTAFSAYLRIAYDSEHFYIGTTTLNRDGIKDSKTVGMFVNTSPILIDYDDSDTFDDAVGKVSKKIIGAFRHQKYSYNDILEDLYSNYGGKNKLYDVLFNHYQQLKSLRIDIQKHSAIFVNYTT